MNIAPWLPPLQGGLLSFSVLWYIFFKGKMACLIVFWVCTVGGEYECAHLDY
jgi:hypothetical protein